MSNSAPIVLMAALVSAAFTASILACFAPEEDCAALAINTLDAARQEILVSAYVLTKGSGIPAALIRAKGRGVDVRLVADRWTPARARRGSPRSLRQASRYGSTRVRGSRSKRSGALQPH